MFCSIISLPLKDEDGRLIAPTSFSARLLDSCLFSRTHRHIPSTDLPTFLPVSRAHHFDHFDHLKSAPPQHTFPLFQTCVLSCSYTQSTLYRTKISGELNLVSESSNSAGPPQSRPPFPPPHLPLLQYCVSILITQSYHPILDSWLRLRCLLMHGSNRWALNVKQAINS